jgi:hypothetical protein
MSQNSMILVQSSWQESQTFRLVPITTDCPYVECILDPATKVFVVIAKITKTSLHMIPRLDDNGDPMLTKGLRPNGRNVKEERKTVDTFQEYYIEDRAAMDELIKLLAINAKTFDYKKFLVESPKEDLPVAGI